MRQTGNTLMKERKKSLRRRMKMKTRRKNYQVAHRILVKGDRSSKFGDYAYKGPNEIVEVNNNGTVKIRKGSVTDVFNIRNIKPYHQ